MSGELQWFLLVMSCLSLAGFGLSGFLVSACTERAAEARRAARTGDHAACAGAAPGVSASPGQAQGPVADRHGRRVFGFDPTTPDRYPLRWGIVVAVALALAKGAHSVVGDLGGTLSWFAIPVVWIGLCRALLRVL